MSEYTSKVAGSRGVRAMSVVSVGDTIDVNQVYNSSHPLYQEYTKRLSQRMSEIIARESEKQAKAQQAVCTVALPAESRDEVAREFPEFRVVWPQWRVPVHANWTARRQLVNQYMMHHVRNYASSFVHYGGDALAYLTFGLRDVQLRVNTTSAVAVHDSFEDDIACSKFVASATTAATSLGWIADVEYLREYASGSVLLKDRSTHRSQHTADALIVDGALYALSPLQFATAMLQHGSGVGMFALPYHPSMLVHHDGVLPGTDVYYSLSDQDLVLKYPEGVAGVTRYVASVWHQWLTSGIRTVDGLDARSFQYELMGVRGSFMIIRVVCIESEVPKDVKFVHSLQLEAKDDYTLVRTWRLKSLAVDVTKESSWEQVSVTVPTRVVEKTHNYAMALDASQFSRHAIRKRLAIVNDRVIVQGTSVQVHEAMRSNDLDVLEIALFTHCFVARYETGRLAAELRAVVDKFAAFGSLSFASRLAHVMSACASLVYDWTLGAVDEVLRSAFDRARVWLGGLPNPKRSEFLPVPQFIRYETLINASANTMFSAVRGSIGRVFTYLESVPSMPGFDYAAAMGCIVDCAPDAVPLVGENYAVSQPSADLFSDVVDTSLPVELTDAKRDVYNVMRQLNEFDEDGENRHHMVSNYTEADVHALDIQRRDYQYDPGFVATLDDFHEAVIPGMRNVEFKYDPSSISTDDQDRSLAADRLELPLDFGSLPNTMRVYESNLHGYAVTKRPMSLQETLSAFHARNLSAPVLALPQHDAELVAQVWDDFLDIACVSGARKMLVGYQNDPVSLEERALCDWAGKVRPDNVKKVFKYLVDNPEAWQEMLIGRYDSMIKSDVKPPLSDKPLHTRVEPQVIVHHMAHINAVFSSIFRVLVRRFLSLLKPNFMLNLLKDMPQVRDVIQSFHDWSSDLTFLENDFSKYDKSQGQFVHMLETFVFTQLGMNKELLEAWGLGHIDCSIRSVSVGMSLYVRYQRKSGDATTAFGNGILNMLSVIHAYKGTDIVWAVFMGDDSLVAARTVCSSESAIQALAEKFNLQAKYYITPAPYFASNFVLINVGERRVTCVPDPVKRVEKWSMAVTAVDPKWEERYESAKSSLSVYENRSNTVGLARALYERYGVQDSFNCEEVCDAVASAIRTFDDFRKMWKSEVTDVVF